MLAESTGQSPELPESTELALLLHKENLGLLEGLVLEVLEERLRHSVT
jgi:hypothetical protein